MLSSYYCAFIPTLHVQREANKCHTLSFTWNCIPHIPLPEEEPRALCEGQDLSAQGWQQVLAFLLDETNPVFAQPQNHPHRALTYLYHGLQLPAL